MLCVQTGNNFLLKNLYTVKTIVNSKTKIPKNTFLKQVASFGEDLLYWLNYWLTLISEDTSGFRSNTIKIRVVLHLILY